MRGKRQQGFQKKEEEGERELEEGEEEAGDRNRDLEKGGEEERLQRGQRI